MNAFKVLDKDGKAIGINSLDAEVAELWGFKTEDKKEYAKEKSRDEFPKGIKGSWEYASQSNWYDTIGWMFAEGKSCQDILDYYEKEVFQEFIGDVDEDGTEITLEYIIPKRVLLLKTWIEKGYQPIQLKDYN